MQSAIKSTNCIHRLLRVEPFLSKCEPEGDAFRDVAGSSNSPDQAVFHLSCLLEDIVRIEDNRVENVGA